MSISIYGWGSGAITTWGMGAMGTSPIIPSLTAQAICETDAYTCVITRDYVEIKARGKGEILLRLKPGSIPARTWGALLDRAKGDIDIRNIC